MEYTKNCGKCNSIQKYLSIGNLNRAIKNNTLCKKCNNKNVSDETREKLSSYLSGKPKSKKAVEKMKSSLVKLWKNKSETELNNWKKIVSKTSTERWNNSEYKNRVANSVKKHWNSMEESERTARFLKQQDGGAGRCKYMNINDYLVQGMSEARYIKSLYEANLPLPIKKKRMGIITPFGMVFPDFEYDECFVEIKSAYTFKKMIEQRTKSENCQLGKLIWVMNNIKNVKILVETTKNKFEDKTNEILPFIGNERVCEYSGLIKTETYVMA